MKNTVDYWLKTDIAWRNLEDWFFNTFGGTDYEKIGRDFALQCSKKVLPFIDIVAPKGYNKHWELYNIGIKRDQYSSTEYKFKIDKLGKIADEVNAWAHDIDNMFIDDYSAAWEAAWTVQTAVGLVGQPFYNVCPMLSACAESSMRAWSNAGNCQDSVSKRIYWLDSDRQWQYDIMTGLLEYINFNYTFEFNKS